MRAATLPDTPHPEDNAACPGVCDSTERETTLAWQQETARERPEAPEGTDVQVVVRSEDRVAAEEPTTSGPNWTTFAKVSCDSWTFCPEKELLRDLEESEDNEHPREKPKDARKGGSRGPRDSESRNGKE